MSERISNPQRAEGGYTLLELMLVLAVLSVMFLLLIPGTNGIYQRYELDTAARQTVSDLRAAQMSAWAHQDTHELWFNKFEPQYRLLEEGQSTGQVRLAKWVSYRNGYLENGVSLIRFYPSGVAAGSGSIRFTNKQKEQVDLTVYPSSGHVVSGGVRR